MLLQEGLCRRAPHQGSQLARIGRHQQAVQFADLGDAGSVRLTRHRDKKRTRVSTPASIGATTLWNQRAGQLLDVIGVGDFSEQVPLHRACLKRIQNHITALTIEIACQVAAIGVSNHGSITALQSRLENFLNGRALAGTGRADELEMFGFICQRHGNTRQRDPTEPRLGLRA